MSRVLVVEDHKDVSFMVSETLKDHIGCQVITAYSGPECLEMVRDTPPDVILLDIHMPGMDGFQVCKILKGDEATKHIPIIFLTATSLELKDRIKGLEIGADDYLIQPVNNLELITRVKAMLRIKKLCDRVKTSGEDAGNMQGTMSNFFSLTCHELRTPLNSIIGFSELLEDEFYGTLNPQQKEFVGLIYKNGKKLEQIISDLADLSKIEAGEMKLIMEEIPLPSFIDGSMAEIESEAHAKNISLNKKIGQGINTINVDRVRFHRLITILLDNAVKFSPKGGVVTVAADREDDRFMGISITGSGIDMSQEDSERIRKQESGLGFTLIKKLIKMHGGDIKVESGSDKGTVFRLTIPCK